MTTMTKHRLTHLIALTALAVFPLSPGAAAQTSPFSISAEPPAGRTAPAAVPDEPSSKQTPASPATASPATASPTSARPFDVNGDGRTPVEPVDDPPERAPRPATTTSALGLGAAAGLAVDAVSADDRLALNALLKQQSDRVRELRVNVANADEWVESVVDKPVVPFRTLRLDGERQSKRFSVFVSRSEAARGGTLAIAFTNSVLVLPEASRLRVFLNGRPVAETAIDSPGRTKVVALPVAPGLLRAGQNAIRLVADMRHRIDCSIAATFELWTRIDTRLTGFAFGGAPTPLVSLGDLPAIGVATSGATRLRAVLPNPSDTAEAERLMVAVQAAALRGRFAQPLVDLAGRGETLRREPGVVTLAIGRYDALIGMIDGVPREAAVGPLVALVDDTQAGPMLVVSGPTDTAVDGALARLAEADPPERVGPTVAATPPWLVPDAPRIASEETITLADAGLETIAFTGRRMTASFRLTLPADFYAAAYGEATLLLDAAYREEVAAGSRLNIIVNGRPTTSIVLAGTTGPLLEDYAVPLPMANFRPGINHIEFVAELETEGDVACLPGGTVQAEERFALFSSTRLAFPTFARIGQLPNLAAFATSGFPYGLSTAPLRLRIADTSADTIGAAATLMAKLAVSRGAALDVTVVDGAAPHGGRSLVVIGPLPSVSNLALDVTGVDEVVPANWLQPVPMGEAGPEPEGLERYNEVLRRLRRQVRLEDDGIAVSDAPVEPGAAAPFVDQRNETERLRQRWLDTADASGGLPTIAAGAWTLLTDTIAIDINLGGSARQREPAGAVPDNATLILAQAPAPDDERTAWTLVTAPTAALLSTSLAALTAPEEWTRIGGRLSAYAVQDRTIEIRRPERVRYLATLPLTFANLRLIAANWFSINNGIYAAALVIAALVLGLLSHALVSTSRRR